MKSVSLAASLVAALLATEPVLALSVTNRDDREHKLTVIEGESKKDLALKPAQVLEGVCQKGCIVRLNDNPDENEDYELDGSETVSIEDGNLDYDGPDAPAEGTTPAPGTATPAAPSPAAPAPAGSPPPKQ